MPKANMSVIDGYSEFEQLSNRLNNPYAAINKVSSQARKLMVNHNLLESQAVTWAITGKKPKHVIDTKKESTLANILRSIRFEIDAPYEVKESVVASIYQSLKSSHLIYKYTQKLDEFDRPRVDILTNIWWSKINSEYVIVSRYRNGRKHSRYNKVNR